VSFTGFRRARLFFHPNYQLQPCAPFEMTDASRRFQLSGELRPITLDIIRPQFVSMRLEVGERESAAAARINQK